MTFPSSRGQVASVARDSAHRFSKTPVERIELVAGEGVAGDAHRGETVQHLSRIRANPSQPNLRQVHLIHAELFDDLGSRGFSVGPGDLGENIVTRGIALLALPRGTLLKIGSAELEVTGLRNPCKQIEAFEAGLLKAVLDRGSNGELIRKAGIMGIVRQGGSVAVGDEISVVLPEGEHLPLEPV